MYNILITIIIALFVIMLFFNLYLRIKAMKLLKKLRQKNVHINIKDLFNAEKIEKVVIPRHPNSADDIRALARHFNYSIKMGTVLLVLITAFGAVLMWYRNA